MSCLKSLEERGICNGHHYHQNRISEQEEEMRIDDETQTIAKSLKSDHPLYHSTLEFSSCFSLLVNCGRSRLPNSTGNCQNASRYRG